MAAKYTLFSALCLCLVRCRRHAVPRSLYESVSTDAVLLAQLASAVERQVETTTTAVNSFLCVVEVVAAGERGEEIFSWGLLVLGDGITRERERF